MAEYKLKLNSLKSTALQTC